ncbi:MAG: hypothetical protein IJV24_07360 [Prevotella sp.]|nr:hypothetical protein [Prevotella sp.]
MRTVINLTRYAMCAWAGYIFGICMNQGRYEAAAIMVFLLALLIIFYTTMDIIYNKKGSNE